MFLLAEPPRISASSLPSFVSSDSECRYLAEGLGAIPIVFAWPAASNGLRYSAIPNEHGKRTEKTEEERLEESSGRLGADQATARFACTRICSDGGKSCGRTSAARLYQIFRRQCHWQAASAATDAYRLGGAGRNSPARAYFFYADATALQIGSENDYRAASASAGAH